MDTLTTPPGAHPMTQPYLPRPDSLAAHVCAFFRANADERLSLDDITVKWDTTRGNIHTQLSRAVDAQLLARSRDDDGEYLYSAGSTLSAASVPDAHHKSRPRTKGYASPRRALLDLDQLKVEQGIPFTPGGTRGRGKWDPLFDKLTTPGQSVAIPGDLKPAVLAAALKRNKERRGTYRVQMTGPSQARVWRVA